jgi:hypothetical protein
MLYMLEHYPYCVELCSGMGWQQLTAEYKQQIPVHISPIISACAVTHTSQF